MPIFTTKHLFSIGNVNFYAPESKGVYGLYDGSQKVIYYGRSVTNLRDRLYSHLNGYEGYCTKSATYFNVEQHHDPIKREKDLLDEYYQKNGRYPKCNDIGA